MKFICSDNRTREELKRWATGKELIFARFFFWAAGTEKQRSVEGLYRAILWEALRECSDIAEELFPDYWQSLVSSTTDRLEDDGFTTTRLRAAFGRLVTREKISQRHKICIFIDGLDEYTGDHWDIAKNLIIWSRNPNIKICVSCRPHNEFEHHFGTDHPHKLQLHQLTRSDMNSFLRDELFDDERSEALRDQPDYERLEEDLVERAEGVFLWLTLAVKDILDGLGSAYSVSQLQMRLAAIPDAVENIYARLLDSIPSHDRKLACRTFLAVLELRKVIWQREARSDIIFFFLDDLMENDFDFSELNFRSMNPNLTDEEMKRLCETIKKRINKRCKGLLQFGPGGWFNGSHIIEPVHRTVLDYLTRSEVMAGLNQEAVDFDAHRSLLLCHIRLLRAVTLGAQYHPHERPAPEGFELDCYRLSRQVLIISNQVMNSIMCAHAPNTNMRDIMALGEALEPHFPNFRVLRNSKWLISTCPGVWKRRQFAGLFSGHDNSYETSFVCFLESWISEDIWDLILSKTKYNSTTATVKLLLTVSVGVSQTMEWSEERAERGIGVLKFLLNHKLDPNGELPEETICIRARSDYHSKYGDYWTSWTASLFSAVSFVTAREKPNPYLVELVETYLSNGADASVALIGYLIEDDNFEVLHNSDPHNSDPLPTEPDYSGPFYIDVIQLLRVWKSISSPVPSALIKEPGRPSLTSLIPSMINFSGLWNVQTKNRISKLDIAELGSKVLVVLNVVPRSKLPEVVIEELECLLQRLKSRTEIVEFVNMI
jgi:hypothetical protein